MLSNRLHYLGVTSLKMKNTVIVLIILLVNFDICMYFIIFLYLTAADLVIAS